MYFKIEINLKILKYCKNKENMNIFLRLDRNKKIWEITIKVNLTKSFKRFSSLNYFFTFFNYIKKLKRKPIVRKYIIL